MHEAIDNLHDYWFGELDEAGMPRSSRNSLWFQSNTQTDSHCATYFGDASKRAIEGQLDDWAATDRGLIALVLLLDQMPRNIYRGTPQAFAGDERALALSQQTIASGHHQRLPAIAQVFLFMPLEHHEQLEVQEECVELFTELAAVTGQDLIAGFKRYAVAHRDVIARFGRFPHRNAILGRTSTPEELAYLADNGGF